MRKVRYVSQLETDLGPGSRRGFAHGGGSSPGEVEAGVAESILVESESACPDRRVEFDAQIGRLKFAELFFVEDMVFAGKLAL